jgi:hypothetical protein
MKYKFLTNPQVRSVSIFGVVAVLVTGVTYAALQSQATLTNNTIASATASLQVQSTGSFASQDAGFAFTGVIPGGSAVPALGNAFKLRNNGTIDLDIAASIPTAPTFTVSPVAGPVDLSKVDLVLSCTTGANSFALTTDIAALVAAHGTGGVSMTPDNLPFSGLNTADCTVQVQMDSDAFTGGSANSTNFNIVFTGTN